MRGERAAAHRTGNDAGEVEHLDVGERTVRAAKFARRRVADLLDGQQRQLGDRAALRMIVPFGERAACGDDQPGFGGGGFERFRLPAVERALHRGLVVRDAEKFEEPAAMMRQIGMQPREAAVAAAIKPGDVVVVFVGDFAVDAQISFAAKFDRRAAHIDTDVLPASAAQPPQLRGRQRRRGNRRLRRGAHRERRRQHRLDAGELDLAQRGVVAPRAAPQAGEDIFGIGSGHPI